MIPNTCVFLPHLVRLFCLQMYGAVNGELIAGVLIVCGEDCELAHCGTKASFIAGGKTGRFASFSPQT